MVLLDGFLSLFLRLLVLLDFGCEFTDVAFLGQPYNFWSDQSVSILVELVVT